MPLAHFRVRNKPKWGVTCPNLGLRKRRERSPYSNAPVLSPLSRSPVRPPSVRPAPAPCTARWPRRAQTRGQRRPPALPVPVVGPQASAHTWPSGSPWAVAAAAMGTLVTCCPGRLHHRLTPTTSFGPGAPETMVHPRPPPSGRVSLDLPTCGAPSHHSLL